MTDFRWGQSVGASSCRRCADSEVYFRGRSPDRLVQVQLPLTFLAQRVSMQVAQRFANSTNMASILTTSPQTVTASVGFTIQNLAPFDQSMYVVASYTLGRCVALKCMIPQCDWCSLCWTVVPNDRFNVRGGMSFPLFFARRNIREPSPSSQDGSLCCAEEIRTGEYPIVQVLDRDEICFYLRRIFHLIGE